MALRNKGLAAALLAVLPAVAVAAQLQNDPAEPKAEAKAAEPAETGTDSGEAAERIVDAAASDIIVGSEVRDTSGALVGRIETVNAADAVVSTGSVKARLPFSSFGKDADGLVISLTRAEFEAAAAGPDAAE